MPRIFLSLFLVFILHQPGIHAQKSDRQLIRSSLTGKLLNTYGEPLSGSSIYISDQRIGASTNEQGEFELKSIAEGNHLIEVSHIGYRTITKNMMVTGDMHLNFTLSDAIVENNEVVITGVGTATQSKRTPIPVMVIRRDELFRSASTNIIEALTRKPGISSITTGPGISKPVIRGLGSNRIITMNDGMKQEGQQWGDEHGIEIDESSVNKIEIVKGPAALIYGSDALGGVINIFTNVPVPAGTLKGNLSSNYQSNNDMHSLNANLAGNQQGFNWNAYTSTVRAADYENKLDGKVYNSKFRQDNFGGYAGYNHSWGYTHIIFSSFKEKLGIIEGLRDKEGYFVKPITGGGTERANSADFRGSTPGIPYQDIDHVKISMDNNLRFYRSRIDLSAGYQRNKRKEFADIDNPHQPGLYFDLKTYNLRMQFHLPQYDGWKTSIGFNGLHQTNENKGEEFLIPEYRMNDIGAYFYGQKTIKGLSLSGGFRFDTRQLDSKSLMLNASPKFEAFSRRFSNFSGSLGASYKLDSSIILKANLARGFRAPTIPELASNGTHEGTNRYEYGNRSIGSETTIQLDYGFEFNTDHFTFIVNAFRNHFDNFIFYRKLSSASGGDSLVNVNGNDITAYKFDQQKATLNGFEFTLDLHPHPLDWLHIENTFSLVRGRLGKAVEGAIYLPFMPANRMISELRGDFLKDKKGLKNLYIKLELDNTFDQDKTFYAYDTETFTKGYTLFNAGIGGDITGANKRTLLSLHFIANNLTDVAWQSHLSRLKYAPINEATGNRGVYNMGRNFSIKANIPLNFTN